MSEDATTFETAPVVLKVENLRYLNKGLRHHLSLDIYAGEIIAILGASGTGKTTLLNTLSGLLPADGMLILAGKYLNDLSPKEATQLRRKHFSILKANPPAPLAKKVGAAITEMITAHRQNPPLYLDAVTSDLKLAPLLKLPLAQQPDSTKQKVAFAGALGKKAKILFADNPTRRMTPDDTELAMQTLHKIARKQRMAVVYSTSDPALAALADRVLVIRNGEIIVELAGADTANQDLFTSYLAELAYPPVKLKPLAPSLRSLFASLPKAEADLTEAGEDLPAETGQFPIILPLPNRPEEPDLEDDFDEDAGEPTDMSDPSRAYGRGKATVAAFVSSTVTVGTVASEQTEEISLEILGDPKGDLTVAPLPGESLEETLQRLAPTRSFDPDSAHLLDEAKRILESLPGAVAPNPVWPQSEGENDV